jgi:hypothetical protein
MDTKKCYCIKCEETLMAKKYNIDRHSSSSKHLQVKNTIEMFHFNTPQKRQKFKQLHLIKLFANHPNLPLQILEFDEFRFLTDTHICTETALEQIQKICPLMEEIAKKLFIESEFCSLSYDTWESKRHIKFFGIHCSLIVNQKYYSINLLLEEIDDFHITGQYLSQKLTDLYKKYQFPISKFTSDTGSAELKCAELLTETHTWKLKHKTCGAHRIHNCMTAFETALPDIFNVLRLMICIGKTNRFRLAAENIAGKIEEIRFQTIENNNGKPENECQIPPVSLTIFSIPGASTTRWYWLPRTIKAITLLNEAGVFSSYNDIYQENPFPIDDLNLVYSMKEFAAELDKLFMCLQKEQASIAWLHWAYIEFERILLNLILEDDIFQPGVSAAISKLKHQMEIYENEDQPDILISSFLNPQLGLFLREDEETHAIDYIINELCHDSFTNIHVLNQELKASKFPSFLRREAGEMEPTPRLKEIQFEIQVYQAERKRISTSFNEILEIKGGLISWWILQKERLPRLAHLAQKLLIQQGSSAAVERLFSLSGMIESVRRCHMNSSRLISITFLKANPQLFEIVMDNQIIEMLK